MDNIYALINKKSKILFFILTILFVNSSCIFAEDGYSLGDNTPWSQGTDVSNSYYSQNNANYNTQDKVDYYIVNKKNKKKKKKKKKNYNSRASFQQMAKDLRGKIDYSSEEYFSNI
ncbi:MAG: hypothetical protein GY730_02990 [bacterium]|nr:hypothetical protein [bacterium]